MSETFELEFNPMKTQRLNINFDKTSMDGLFWNVVLQLVRSTKVTKTGYLLTPQKNSMQIVRANMSKIPHPGTYFSVLKIDGAVLCLRDHEIYYLLQAESPKKCKRFWTTFCDNLVCKSAKYAGITLISTLCGLNERCKIYFFAYIST